MNNLKKLVKESKKVTKELEGLLPKPPKKKRSIMKSIKRAVGVVAFPATIVIVVGLLTWGFVATIQYSDPTITEISRLENDWYEIKAEDGRAWVSKDGMVWLGKKEFDTVNSDLDNNLDKAFYLWELQMAFNSIDEQEK